MREISSNSAYDRIRESKLQKKDNQKPATKTQAREDNFEQIDERLDDSLGSNSTNTSYNNRLKNTPSGVKRREQFNNRQEDTSSISEQPAYSNFYEENNTDSLYTTKAEPLREQRFNNLPSDPMAAREYLREQYEKSKGITGEQAVESRENLPSRGRLINIKTLPEGEEIPSSGKETSETSPGEAGIKWSNNGNNIDEEKENMLKDLVSTLDKGVPEKYKSDFLIDVNGQDPKGVAGGTTYPGKKKIDLYTRHPMTGNALSDEEIVGNLTHEYGHAFSAKLKEMAVKEGKETYDEKDQFYTLRDSEGKDLYTRGMELEADARKRGFEPGAGKVFSKELINEILNDEELIANRNELRAQLERGEISSAKADMLDNRKLDEIGRKKDPNYIYDKYDPWVNSLNYSDETGHHEKYTRKDKDEFFAETFKTYKLDPDGFKNKMAQMEDYLSYNKEGTDEYNHVKKSLGVMKDSYKAIQSLLNETD